MKLYDSDWKGYTIDELKVRRMVNLTRIELEKEKLAHALKPITDKKDRFAGHSLIGKITGALDYVDYVMIAFNISRRLFKIFHRKRR